MIDRKKIADALREIASFYAPDPDCTNAIYDSLTAIIDELDPPEPKPLLADAQVGDWVEHRESKEQARIVHIASVEYDGITIKFSYSNETEIYSTREFNIEFRKLKPSEVIVNIGCLSGPVRRSSSSHFCIICGDHWSMIAFAMLLDTATRELVESLLKAQEEK